MKILFISRGCHLGAGGMERFSYDLIQNAKKDSSLSVGTIYHRGSRLTSPFFSLLVIPLALLRSRHYDVVHLGDPMLSLVGWLIKIFWHKPIAVTVHGLDITYPHPLYQLYLRLFFCSFTNYFPISAAVSDLLRQLSVTGLITIINPPLSIDFYDPTIDRSDLLSLLAHLVKNFDYDKQSSRQVYLLTTGRLVSRKGQGWFISHVLPSLPKQVHYLVAGNGPQEATLRGLIQSHHLDQRVHLLGRVSTNDLRILYNTVDAFIQPNLIIPGDIEGFGLVLLEAAACQRPVFASAIEGLVDAIKPPHNGLLLPAGDSVRWQQALSAFINHRQPAYHARTYTLKNYTWSSYLNSLHTALANSALRRR